MNDNVTSIFFKLSICSLHLSIHIVLMGIRMSQLSCQWIATVDIVHNVNLPLLSRFSLWTRGIYFKVAPVKPFRCSISCDNPFTKEDYQFTSDKAGGQQGNNGVWEINV